MSAIQTNAPLLVIPYAIGPAAASGSAPERLLRAATRLGFFACALTLFFVPVWFADSVRNYDYNIYTQCVTKFVPFLQTLFMGAGLALTLAGRPVSREVRGHPRYALALMLNLLVFIGLYCEWTIHPPRGVGRWNSLTVEL